MLQLAAINPAVEMEMGQRGVSIYKRLFTRRPFGHW